jgi:hypothetical protein
MHPSVLAVLPAWLSSGLLLGLVLTGVIGVVFLIGIWRYPDQTRRASSGSSMTDRRRRALAQYLRDAGEVVQTEGTVAGVPVAIYLPARDVALVFAPAAYLALRETSTQVMLCELEAPPAAIARRLPFLSSPRATDRMGADLTEAFAILGVPTDADPDALRAAYRERVKDCHPDQGGDPAEFARVRRAYERATSTTVG